MTRASILKEPLVLANGTTLPNRFLKSATSEQLGDRNRNPKPGLAKLYANWAKGGTGLLISGNLMVDRSALGEPFNVVLDEQSDLNAFRKWTAATLINGTHFWAQLNHPGKQSPAILSKEPVAPSAIELGRGLSKAFNKPRAMSEREILDVIDRFITAAKLAKQVGFTGVQIHGAHGYLVSQFLSPNHNQRTDKWGGSLENRMRFVIEIYKGIRQAVGKDFPVAIKLNSADFQKGGFTQEDSMHVVDALVQAGIDFIEISGGSYERPVMMTKSAATQKDSTKKREAYFLDYAEDLRKRSNVPLAVTGGFRTSKGMEEAINSGATDMVGMARPLILKPDLPLAAIASADFEFTYTEPTTGNPKLDRAVMLNMVWFEKQMWRIAKNKKPKHKLSPWLTAASAIWTVMTKPPVPRRA
ncbi:NADH oxidase [Pseudovibrio axinellae]|uniref:NADH oxidase n=1 Tax=Pseudovibrio axinellae TaxID=989403 RepID=A0A165Z1A6_9HYPH|nr:NADH:flavin oxidoreductase/NADH oxidase family protein [Pseudovibrio axinellae]KZL19424.1 NADH oxidase [Pseudovibrio axinellae]SER59479.1 2,4-dienoyl-CoA reductase [Pseudovibrio axinellae]